MTKEFIHLQLSGPTASYRLPTAISGTQLALEVPPYSSILGMLSYAAGREITPKDTRLGVIYSYKGKGMDLETIHRWDRRNSGSYGYNDTNIRKRQIHYHISMDIIVDNTKLYDELNSPTRQMTFGRSQDLATLEGVQVIEVDEVETGKLHGCLLPIEVGEDIPADGMFYNLPEYFSYDDGKIRRPRQMRSFLALTQLPVEIDHDNLWKLKDKEMDNKVMYLHEWAE